jgi:predicted glycosyltransferase involved in capsule biosynthesis
MKITSKFLLEIIAKRLILPISAINKSFDLVFLAFSQNLTDCANLDENAFTKQTSVREFVCVLYNAIWLTRKW